MVMEDKKLHIWFKCIHVSADDDSVSAIEMVLYHEEYHQEYNEPNTDYDDNDRLDIYEYYVYKGEFNENEMETLKRLFEDKIKKLNPDIFIENMELIKQKEEEEQD